MRRLALVLGLTTLATQAACESCAFNSGSLEILLTVELVDESGEPLLDIEGRLAAASFRSCTTDHDGERCLTVHPDGRGSAGRFTVSGGGQAYENGLSESGRCSYPDVRLTVEIPGCGSHEATQAGGRVTSQNPIFHEEVTLTCTDAPAGPARDDPRQRRGA